jgi:serine/threonine protein kinase
MNYPDPETVPHTWEVGDVILNKFEVKQIFTGGGMGLVYRVYHREWNMDLAVKSPRPKFLQSKEQVENFERESETWVKLGLHPHIVTCYYVRRLGGIPRIFSEYMEGGSLADWIRTGRLYEGGEERSLKRILDIAIQTAWGLNYAHGTGLVHQDVKPANILMMNDGTAKVSDFGLTNARKKSSESLYTNTHVGESIFVAGCGFMTKEYASPEQLRGEHLSSRSDIYSWAVSLLEMLMRERTWSTGLVAPMVAREFIDARTSADSIGDCLSQCLHIEAEKRIRSMKDAAVLLVAQFNTHKGENYSRDFPQGETLVPRFAHNRAVSLLDINGAASAYQEIYDVARRWPHQIETQFLNLLLLWRFGQLSSNDIIDALKNHEDTPQCNYYRGLIYREGGDVIKALSHFNVSATNGFEEASHFLDESVSPKQAEPKNILYIETRNQRISASCILSDNSKIVTGDKDGNIRVYCLKTNVLLGERKTSIAPIFCITAHPKTTEFVVSGVGPTVEGWDGDALQCVWSKNHGDKCSPSSLFDDTGKGLFVSTSKGFVRHWREINSAHFVDLSSTNESSPLIGLVTVPTRQSIVALRKDWTLLEWRPDSAHLGKTIAMPKLKDQYYVASHVGRPQLAAIPSGHGVLVSTGYQSAIFDLESLSFTHFYNTSGWVTRSDGTFGAACEASCVSLYDCDFRRLYRELPAPLHGGEKSPYVEFFCEAPTISIDSTLIGYSSMITHYREARKSRDGSFSLIENDRSFRLFVWDIQQLVKNKKRLEAPIPVIKPSLPLECFSQVKIWKSTMEDVKRLLNSGEAITALNLIDSGLAESRFTKTSEIFAMRWQAGKHLIRDQLTSVVQRASQGFRDTFAYFPQESRLFTQCQFIDDSMLYDVSPDNDGISYWMHGNTYQESEISSGLHQIFGAFRIPRFLGLDPINLCLYLESKHSLYSLCFQSLKRYFKPDGIQRAFSKAVRYGSIMMLGQFGESIHEDADLDFLPNIKYDSFLAECEVSLPDRDCALITSQFGLVAPTVNGGLSVFDGFSRRYRTFPQNADKVILVDVSLSSSKLCYIDDSHSLFVLKYPSFDILWSRAIFSEHLDYIPKVLQFSCDEKLILVGTHHCIALYDATTSKEFWRWEGEYRDTILTVDSRFLIVVKSDGFECFELEWRYRQSECSHDLAQMVKLAKIFLNAQSPSKHRSRLPEYIDNDSIAKVSTLLQLVGFGTKADTQVLRIISQAREEKWADADLILFDDCETETGQAAFPFYWDNRYSGKPSILDKSF